MSNGTHEFETTQPSESRDGSHKRNDQEQTYATSPVEAPVALTQQEEHMVKKIRKAKLFVFLRQHRHELFDEAFRGASELASLYRPAHRGHPPVSPAILALTLLQEAYTGVSDDEVRDRDRDGPAVAVGLGLLGYRGGAVQSRNTRRFPTKVD